MNHHCKTCGKTAPAVKFAPQSGSTNPRKDCNTCRREADVARRRVVAVETPQRKLGPWEMLGIESRPDWGQHRKAPDGHSKAQEFAI